MAEKKQGPLYEVAKIKAQQMLVVIKYFEVLQAIQTFVPTVSNLTEAGLLIKNSRAVLKLLTEGRANDTRNERDIVEQKCGGWNEFINPLDTAIKELTVNVKEKDSSAQDEISLIQEENNRILAIKSEFFAFVNQKVQEVAKATTVSEIVAIQKRIGTEKSRKNVYQEYVKDLDTLILFMFPYMEKQKALIDKPKTFKTDDPVVLTALMGELEASKKYNIEEMQVKCLEMVHQLNDFSVEATISTLKGRMLYRYEVVDEEKAIKKHPELCSLDKAKVKEYAASLREQVSENPGKEIVDNGIRFFFIKSI
jgi:hypothetical protein